VTALDDLVAKVNKRLGDQILIRGSDLSDVRVQRCTTGSLSFDLMLGGGWPLNCWSEIVGNESMGKTALAMKTIAANQALDPSYEALWVASEEFVKDWAESLGVDLSRIVVVRTSVMEDVYQTVIDALDARAVDAVVIDSLPALVPSAEDERTMNDVLVALGARLTGQFMRKSNKAQRRSLSEEDRPCVGLIINQWRDRVGVMHGDPRTTPGGKAKNFSYFTRVDISRDEWITSGTARVGLVLKARTIKNKVYKPQQVGTVDFYFDDAPPFHQGDFDIIKEVTNLAIVLDIVTRRGAYYDYGSEKWKGKDQLLASVREEVGLQNELTLQVRHLVLGEPLPKKPNGRQLLKRSASHAK
jgi:recombination protein RecA